MSLSTISAFGAGVKENGAQSGQGQGHPRPHACPGGAPCLPQCDTLHARRRSRWLGIFFAGGSAATSEAEGMGGAGWGSGGPPSGLFAAAGAPAGYSPSAEKRQGNMFRSH